MTSPILDWRIRLDDLAGSPRDAALTPPSNLFPALAKAIGVDSILSCEADLRLVPDGAALDVTGRVRARVVQTCGVSLEPFETEIDEPVDARFASEDTAAGSASRHLADGEEGSPGMDAPEPLVDGVADLGSLVQEFLSLGVDPYPRKPGVAFDQATDDTDKPSPFAALAKLRTPERDGEG